jgi:hypothetical protein
MSALTRAFRNAAAHACQRQGSSFAEFLGNRGIEADANGYSAQEIAAHVLVSCCVTGGRYNNFQVGLLAVMKFLSDQFGAPTLAQAQMFRDLLAILNQGGDYQSVLTWAHANYP